MTRQSPLRWDDLQFDPVPFMKAQAPIRLAYASNLGALYADDCMAILPWVKDGVVDTVFADPPFNLGKQYGSKSNDSLSEQAYLDWCKQWVAECHRVLKPGGSLFLYNLPKWN